MQQPPTATGTSQPRQNLPWRSWFFVLFSFMILIGGIIWLRNSQGTISNVISVLFIIFGTIWTLAQGLSALSTFNTPASPPQAQSGSTHVTRHSNFVKIVYWVMITVCIFGLIAAIFFPSFAPDTSAFDFENGTQGWITSDSNTQLTVTTNPAYSGKQALEVKTQLSAPASIEVAAYFNQVKPAGFDSLGPYDFFGKHISCFMYLPNDLAKEVFIQIFVKDRNSVIKHFPGTEYSQPYSIDPSRTGNWIEISYQVGKGTPDPKGFNAAEVDAMGIRIETSKGSLLTFKGSLYIDDCTIKSQ